MNKEYSIRTFQDVFDLPTDKIPACMRDIADGMVLAKNTLTAMQILDPSASMQWPCNSTWIDDGKREITANVSVNNIKCCNIVVNPEDRP